MTSNEKLPVPGVSRAPRPTTQLTGGGGWSPPQIQTTPSEPLDYEFPFSEDSDNRVRAEMIRADRDFEQREKESPLTQMDRQALALQWVCRGLAAFGREACRLARAGDPDWRLSKIEDRVKEVRRQLILGAMYSKFVGGHRPKFVCNWGGVEEEVIATITRSPEWSQYQADLLDLMTGSVGTLTSAGISTAWVPTSVQEAQTRTQMVDAFLRRCNQEVGWGFKLVRKHFSMAVGHKSPRQFQFWQSGSNQTTSKGHRDFERILSMEPGAFIVLLEKRGLNAPIS